MAVLEGATFQSGPFALMNGGFMQLLHALQFSEPIRFARPLPSPVIFVFGSGTNRMQRRQSSMGGIPGERCMPSCVSFKDDRTLRERCLLHVFQIRAAERCVSVSSVCVREEICESLAKPSIS
jgi:hypothetical protein